MAHRRSTPLVLALLCLASLGVPATAHADMSVSPLFIEVAVEPGDKATEQVVLGSDDEAILVEFVHKDLGFDESTYQQVLIPDDAPETTAFSTRGWFSVPQRRIRIPAGGQVQVPLTISVPPNAAGGTNLGAALFRTVAADTGDGNQVAVSMEAGALVFVEVVGGTPPRPRLRTFDLPRLVTGGPLHPEVVVENTGETWFEYEGEVTLDDGDGDNARIEVPHRYVVPDLPREVRGSGAGTGDELALGSRRLGVGRHEVELRLRIEPTGKTIRQTRVVWVVPPWLWVVIAFVVGALVLAAVIWIRRRRELHRLMRYYLESDAAEAPASEHDGDPGDGTDAAPGPRGF